MKNKFLLLGLILAFVACNDLTDLNLDKKNPVAVPGETLFTSAQKNLVDQMISTNVNNNIFRLFVQHWTETTYTDEANYDLTTRAISQQHWDALYRRSLANFKEAARLISSEEAISDDQVKEKANKLAIIEVLTVYTYSVLVESFGNVPYTQALDINNLNPVYDDGLTVYKDLISRLNAAISKLDPSVGSFSADADNIYQGDVAGWMYYANSLKLKMGLVLADVPSETALSKATVESAVAGGVIDDNEDNTTLEYGASSPNTNTLWSDLVASGRQDFIGTSRFINTLDSLNDPRLTHFFQHNTDDPATPEVEFIGGEYGINSIFSQYSNVSAGPVPGDFALLDPTFPGTIMNLAYTEFLLAEAVARGYNVGGTIEEHYNAGITASILEWGGTQAEADAYLAQPDVAYATAGGDWKQKIGTQAWIALYNMGFEAWTEWRRLDWPKLVKPSTADDEVPVRMTYPVVEQTLNGAQYDAAAAAIGGDLLSTKLFFDKF